MTDVTVAPEGSAPPAASEVQINENPVASPQPIGSQTPVRERTVSESVQRAIDRATNPQKPERHAEKPAPKAAEAKVGHNKPPETEKIDLRKPPPKEQERGEHGHFAPREKPEAAEKPAAQQATQQQPQQPAKQLPKNAPFREPPIRMSEEAKAEWHATPEKVRGDMHRIQKEFAQAYNFYKNDYEAFKPLRQFHQMAVDHGTTLEQALTNYVGMEQKLRADPIAGLDTIVQNLGLKRPDGSQVTLRDLAYHIATQSPDQLRAVQQGNTQEAANRKIGELMSEISGLKNQMQQMQYNQQHSYTRAQVDLFAADPNYPRFDELGAQIKQELDLGFDLPTAYRRADLLNPTTHAEQTRTTPAQTRTADKSIHGSPSSSANGAARPREPSRNPQEAVANAMKRFNARV